MRAKLETSVIIWNDFSAHGTNFIYEINIYNQNFVILACACCQISIRLKKTVWPIANEIFKWNKEGFAMLVCDEAIFFLNKLLLQTYKYSSIIIN